MHENAGGVSGAARVYRDLLGPLAELDDVLKQYREEYRAVAGDADVEEIRETVASLREEGGELLADGRLLRLGIVGQVKAGKSSLLNALLFDGEEILPRAATPMTASLTHIVKSDRDERDEIEIDYYSEPEWDEIERHAAQYRKETDERAAASAKPAPGTNPRAETVSSSVPPPEPAEFLRASHDLSTMARDRGIRVRDHLGRKDRYEAPVDQLNGKLRDLVGAEGERTPLVKSVTIRCSHGIPDMDIVDTPGINDPVTSRSRETKKLLGRCDVVLLLSYAGQFMDSEDARFFEKQVPAEGIKRKVLLGSKFDSALIDVSPDHGRDLQAALEDTRSRLRAHAIRALRERSGDDDISMSDEDIKFISPICASLAKRPVATWSAIEREVFDNLRRAYPDWLDEPEGVLNDATNATLATIGNANGIDECLQAIREDKDSIMQARLGDFLAAHRDELDDALGELEDDLHAASRDLRGESIADAKERCDSLQRALEEICEKVTDTWEDLVEDEKKPIAKSVKEIRHDAKNARVEIRNAISKEKQTGSEKKEGVGPWFRRLWGSDSGGYKTYIVEVEDQKAMQAAVDGFIDAIRDRLEEAVEGRFQSEFRNRAKSKLGRIVADGVSNEQGRTLDPDAMKRSIRNALNVVRRSAKSSLAEALGALDDALREPLGALDDALRNAEQAESRGSHAERAREVVYALADVADEYADQMSSIADDVTERANTDLLPAITNSITEERKRLEADLRDREFKLQRYELARAAVSRCRERVVLA